MKENERIWPGSAADGEVEIVEERVAWEGKAVRLYNDRVRFPHRGDDGRFAEGEHFRVAHASGEQDGVAIVPIDERDRILLVRQFRHPIRMWLRELPRGARNAGEPPADAVVRELHEEIGHDVIASYPLGRIANDSGQLIGYPYLYAARVKPGASAEPEESEAIDRIFSYRYSELRAAGERGEIVDSFTLCAIVRLAPHFEGDRFTWRGGTAR